MMPEPAPDDIAQSLDQMDAPAQVKPGRPSLLVLLIALLGCALVAGLYFSWHMLGQDEQKAEATTIKVSRVAYTDLSEQISIPGEFRPYDEIDLSAKVKGYIKTLNVDIGSHVHQGQLLATLDVPEVRDDLVKATAAVEHAKQQVIESRLNAENYRQIYERLAGVRKENPELIAQQDIDQARTRAESAESDNAAANAALDEAQANMQQLKDLMDYTQITAPFDGVVTRLDANVGALVGDTSDHGSHGILHLSELSRLRLVTMVPEAVVTRIHEGDPVDVLVPSLGLSKTLPIARMSHQVDPDTRTMHIEIDYPNADLAITPGIYADTRITADSRKHVLSVPLQALASRKADEGKVLLLSTNGTLEPHPVKLGFENATRVEITDGLHEGGLVAIGLKAPDNSAMKYNPVITEIP